MESPLKRILLVEDEPALADTIKLNLELEGYAVQICRDGKSAVKVFGQARFDLVILDVMLPGVDGFSVCQSVRLVNKDIPVLFLTAKNSFSDRVYGLKIGADDYLPKPFNLEEMLLRVSNLLKRTEKFKVPAPEKYSFNGFTINFPTLEVVSSDGTVTKLTKKECTFLKLLIERKNDVLSREEILQTAWGYDIYPSTRTIDNYMVGFRKLFEKDPSNPKHFLSVRGIGYQFVE